MKREAVALTRYELFEFFHVVGAIAWLGGGIGLTILGRRLVAVRDHATLIALDEQGKALGNRLFMSASILTIGFGIAMVIDAPVIGFGDAWILIGFGGSSPPVPVKGSSRSVPPRRSRPRSGSTGSARLRRRRPLRG